MRWHSNILLQVKAASFQAGVSTASMGKFDKRLAGEKPDERQPANKRRTFLPVADCKGVERKSVSAVADKIMREKADDIVEVGKAAGRLEAVAREQRHQAKAPAEGEAAFCEVWRQAGQLLLDERQAAGSRLWLCWSSRCPPKVRGC